LRNTALGAAAEIGVVLLAIRINSNPPHKYRDTTGWVWGVFVPLGGRIGVAIPTAGWHEVYRVH
jgi:hypothetical protein